MSSWTERLRGGEYRKSTVETVTSPITAESRAVADFLRLVRITGACDHQLLLDDEVILAELDSTDLRQLHQIDRQERQAWAQMLAYRLCKRRLENGPPRLRRG